METKAHRRFVQRVEYYDTDIELCELLVEKLKTTQNSNNSLAEALGSTANEHPFLARRINNIQSRKICGAHLKVTLNNAFIKDLFEDFSEFISNTMVNAALKGIDPGRFVGEVKLDISAAELLSAGNWDNAVKTISSAIFRKLENERNTKDLLKKASTRLGLNIGSSFLDAAMPYLDARHILVHKDGKTDDQYRISYPNIRLKNSFIIIDKEFVRNARQTVLSLAKHIDECIINHDLVRHQDISGER